MPNRQSLPSGRSPTVSTADDLDIGPADPNHQRPYEQGAVAGVWFRNVDQLR